MKNSDIRRRSARLGFLHLGSRKETLRSCLPSLLPPASACFPLLASSLCSHREFLFHFVAGDVLSLSQTDPCGPPRCMAVGTSEQEGSSILG